MRLQKHYEAWRCWPSCFVIHDTEWTSFLYLNQVLPSFKPESVSTIWLFCASTLCSVPMRSFNMKHFSGITSSEVCSPLYQFLSEFVLTNLLYVSLCPYVGSSANISFIKYHMGFYWELGNNTARCFIVYV